MKSLHLAAHKFSTDPSVQYKFNAFFTIFWIILMVLAPSMPPFHFISSVADQWGTHTHVDGVALGALLIFEVSLWANAFTHFGALGANVAALIAQGHPEFKNENVLEDYQPAAAEVFGDPLVNADDDENWLFAEDEPATKVAVMSDLSKLTGK